MRLNFDSWFKRRILHVPNWIEIMLNNLCLLEWEFKTRHSRSAILFGKTMRRLNQISRTYSFESTKISIRFGACKMRRLNRALFCFGKDIYRLPVNVYRGNPRDGRCFHQQNNDKNNQSKRRPTLLLVALKSAVLNGSKRSSFKIFLELFVRGKINCFFYKFLRFNLAVDRSHRVCEVSK